MPKFPRFLSGLGRGALLAALAAAPLSAQASESSPVEWRGWTFDNAGGGMASEHLAAQLVLEPLSAGTMSSADFTGTIGFLSAEDADAPIHPVVFGVAPDFGPIAGGTPLVISGLHFGKFGPAQSLVVTIGGHAAADVHVLSDSRITAIAPAGANGPSDVDIAGALDAASRPGGFIYTPAIVTTAVAPMGDTLVVRNYGPVGSAYWTLISGTLAEIPTRFGTLLIGPLVYTLIPPAPYPPSDGVSAVSFAVPVDPVVQGLVVHFQSLSITGGTPLQGSLTNVSTSFIP